jgi:hypothetical protein
VEFIYIFIVQVLHVLGSVAESNATVLCLFY